MIVIAAPKISLLMILQPSCQHTMKLNDPRLLKLDFWINLSAPTEQLERAAGITDLFSSGYAQQT